MVDLVQNVNLSQPPLPGSKFSLDLLQPILSQLNISSTPAQSGFIATKRQAEVIDRLSTKCNCPETIELLWMFGDNIALANNRKNKYYRNGYQSCSKAFLVNRYGFRKAMEVRQELESLVGEVLEKKCHHAESNLSIAYQFIDREVFDAFNDTKQGQEHVWVVKKVNKIDKVKTDIARLADKSIPYGHCFVLDLIQYFISELPTATDKRYKQLKREISVLIDCIQNQENFNPETGILIYKNSFNISALGGRIYNKRGCQLVTGEMKHIWWGGNLKGYRNYDVKSCHPAIFNRLKPTKFLTDWIADFNDFKNTTAVKVGVPKKLLKLTVNAVINGNKLIGTGYSEVFQDYQLEFENDDIARSKMAMVKVLLVDVIKTVSELLKEIKANPKKWQTNAIGMTIDSTDPGELLAHWLQGKEQETITFLSSQWHQTRYGYTVVSNQHDGLVVLGELPSTITDAVYRKFGLKLEVKGFV